MTGYSIDSISQSSELTPTGVLQDVVIATFVTDAGDTGSVRVPLTGDWQSAVTAQVQAQVAAYDAIRGV